jgi:hypothetical protein
MAHSENRDCALVDPVSNHVATVTKINDPVTEFLVHSFNRPSHARLLLQHPDTLANGLHGTLCSIKILRLKKVEETLDIRKRCGRSNQA